MQQRIVEKKVSTHKELELALAHLKYEAEVSIGLGKEVTLELWNSKEEYEVARFLSMIRENQPSNCS